MTILSTFWLLLMLKTFPGFYGGQGVVETRKAEYNLSRPDVVYYLPPILIEISGIAELDASTVACIQDENGVILFYDIVKGRITKELFFFGDGDYEEITRAGSRVFILRSDGNLFGVSTFASGNSWTKPIPTGIPAGEYEAMCYDQKANRLLIAPKNIAEKDSEDKDKRSVYAFDLKTNKLNPKPAYIFNIKILENYASQNKLKVPEKNGKGDRDVPDLEFNPSAMAIHPLTNRIYIISGSDRVLYVFNLNGNIEYMEKLDSDLFNQPEGITFLGNGDMLVSNEGSNKAATMLRFNYLKK